MKQCYACKETKPLDSFYRLKRMTDGHVGKCKECTKYQVRKNRAAKIDYYREWDRKRSHNPERIALRNPKLNLIGLYCVIPIGHPARQEVKSSNDLYIKRNPKKYRAHTTFHSATLTGKLIRQPCEVCGSTTVHGHHDDYSKPLDVRWLCPKHHSERHKLTRNTPIQPNEII
jgi:hypothetical protein